MAFLTISGEVGCRTEEVAQLTANLLRFEFVTESRLREMVVQEFGSESAIPEKAWPSAVTSILARLATESPMVVCASGAEMLFPRQPFVMRTKLIASESRRTGLLMLDHRLDRAGARTLLAQLERHERDLRRQRFGSGGGGAPAYDLVVSTEQWDSAHVATLLEYAARSRGMAEDSPLSTGVEAQIQFQTRMKLARFGITAPGKAALKRRIFANPSEEMFANLLDFYRITWEYEPKSFPIQWDSEGRVLEAFTPDFYLAEFDLYVELTTMKQAHVTKKNRKIKMLRSMYPHINIQVFYQKDFKNLIFKHGLAERGVLA